MKNRLKFAVKTVFIFIVVLVVCSGCNWSFNDSDFYLENRFDDILTGGLISITVSPVSPVLGLGDYLQFQAIGNYKNGESPDITEIADWSSSNTNIVAVSNELGLRGRVEAIGYGSAVISASYNGVSSTDYGVSAAILVEGIHTFYVSVNTGDDNDGIGSRAKPFKSLDKAFSMAAAGDSVNVAGGVYTVSGPVVLKEGMKVLGGYEDAGWTRNAALYNTDVSQIGGGVVTPGSPDAVFVMDYNVSANTVLDGFHIYGAGTSYSSAVKCLDGSAAVISNNTIDGGSGSMESTGIYSRSADLKVENNVINGGSSGTVSYGMYMYYGSPVVDENQISGGSSPGNTNGIYVDSASPLIMNNRIESGNGNDNYAVKMTLSSGYIYNNEMKGGGGTLTSNGIHLSQSYPTIAGNTIYPGTGTTGQYGIYLLAVSSPDIRNNIIYSTGSANFIGIYENGSDPSTLDSNDIYNSGAGTLYNDGMWGALNGVTSSGTFTNGANNLSTPTGVDNITKYPLFSDFLGGNWRLTQGSPPEIMLKGANLSGFPGIPTGSSGLPVDKDGNPRGNTWSMGAFEQDGGTITLLGDDVSDGYRFSGGGTNQGAPNTLVGDAGTPEGVRSFFAFPITELAGAVIDDAQMRVYKSNTIGNPSALGGTIFVDHVTTIDYSGSTILADFFSFPAGGLNDWRLIPVTSRVQPDVDALQALTWYRLHFQLDTNGDGIDDQDQFFTTETGGSEPKLTVTFHVR